eukprot:6214462-Pleurochrysis_carterae.AAC.2
MADVHHSGCLYNVSEHVVVVYFETLIRSNMRTIYYEYEYYTSLTGHPIDVVIREALLCHACL